MSGVVYDVIHNVPFTGRNPQTGEVQMFTNSGRDQYAMEGILMSASFAFLALLLIGINKINSKYTGMFSLALGLGGIILIYMYIGGIEEIYKSKSWYGPSYFPPEGYNKGSVAMDQGNNIWLLNK